MKDREVHINELTLRIHGMNKKEAGNIGADVAREIADNLPDTIINGSSANVNLKVTMQRGTSRKDLTRLISEAILQKLI
jgi:hypothetical protein